MSGPQSRRARFVELAGAQNFRDLGGYDTIGGRRVASGLVYRSGTLSGLTEADQAVVTQLGIRVVCDFRSNNERRHRPSRLPQDSGMEFWAHDYEGSVGELLKMMSGPAASAENARQLMIGVYRSLAYEQADAYRELFLRIADGALPLLFHCSAGKDRTGAAAALLLHILGVPRPAIVGDYLLTELCFDNLVKIALHDLGSSALRGTALALWEPLLRADATYIETLFETLERRHHGVEGYVRDILKLDDSVLGRVRRRLLL